MADDVTCYVIVNNIPKSYHSSDLRNFFSQFVETSGFSCFHFRHRPEVQRPFESGDGDSSEKSRNVSLCCIVRVYEHRVDELISTFNKTHWVDRDGHTKMTRCFIRKIAIRDVCDSSNTESNPDTPNQVSEIFLKSDLSRMIELLPPPLMPQGNVGTPTKYFLEQIKACRLPASIISKLKLEFPHTRAKRLYSAMDYNYGGQRAKRWSKDPELLRTSKGDVISENYSTTDTTRLPKDDDNWKEDEVDDEEESEEEEWDRHESLHDDVTQQERTKERLFEEKIELKWEKGGSGLVFYTDAQHWDEKEGDFDAKTADDWDMDMSAYYEPGAGDKDSRDMLKMRLENRLRQGVFCEKTDSNDFAGFEKYTRGFGRRVLESQGWKQGQGVGKTVPGITEPILELGQHPRDKKGFGFRGEKLKRDGNHRNRKRRIIGPRLEEACGFHISTIYDNPVETDPPEKLLRSDFATKLTYRKTFLKQSNTES